MTYLFHFAVIIGVVAIGATPAAAQADNTIEVVIGSGPHAGTYKLSPMNTICLFAKERGQFSAAYRDAGARDAKLVNAVGINVFNPADAGPKRGQVSITFGEANGKPVAEYPVSISADSKASLTITRKGSVADLAFQGATTTGVTLRMSATCREIDEF